MTASGQSIAGVVGRGSAWAWVSTMAMKGVGFFSVLLILNHLTVYEYGFAELVLTTVPFLSLFLLPGLNTTVVADMGIKKSQGNLSAAKGMFLSFVRLQLTFAVTVWASVFFGAHALATFYGHEQAATLFRIISFSFLISPLRTSAQVLQSVFFRFKEQSLYSFLEEACKLALLTLFFLVFQFRAEGLLTAMVLSQTLALLLIVWPLRTHSWALWSASEARYPTTYFLFHHGKWGIFSNYVGTFGRNIRPWLIKFFLGTEAVGIFAVVQGLIGHTTSLIPFDRIITPMLPQYVADRDRLYRIITKAVRYELIGYTVSGFVAVLFSPLFAAWFFPQYLPAIPLFQVMLIILVSVAFDSIFAGVFVAIQAQRNLFKASLYKLLLLIVIMPLCLYAFGLFGIAYANILVNSLYVWERYLTLKRLMPGFSLSFRSFVSIDDTDRLLFKRILRVLNNGRIRLSV